jgi:hypothetical protein
MKSMATIDAAVAMGSTNVDDNIGWLTERSV